MSAPSSIRINADATPPGWRVANFLAIASPYLAGAALFLALYLTRSPVPQSSEPAEHTVAPAVSASGPSVSVFDNSSNASAPPANVPQKPAETAPLKPAETAPQKPAETAPQAKRDALSAPTPPPAQKPTLSRATLSSQPVPVDPAIASTMKLSGAPPVYPPVAKAAGVQGTVVVALTIAPDGSVTDAHAISGPALLQAEAIAAVRLWRYRPFLVYGKASPFETQVSINFTISSSASQP